MLSLRYLPQARAEFLEQVDYYEDQASGLGRLFARAIQDAERRVLGNPVAWPHVQGHREVRAVVVRRFPFRLLYAVRGDLILIVAVAHTAREPTRFLRRLGRGR